MFMKIRILARAIRSTFALGLCVPILGHAQTLDTVEVISTTPLSNSGVAESLAPFSVKKLENLQRDTARESLSQGLFKGISGVQVTDNQGNPYQSDVTYRGFSVTPLLGTPPGLSVYVDGVRQNESFGDVVRFDAIPQSALKSLTVLPGTLPQFGLNSLGGALVLQTKSGRDFQGTQLDLESGDFGRKRVGIQHGWVDEQSQRDVYVNFNAFDEDGWRVMSPSTAFQLFAKMGVVADSSVFNVSLNLFDSDLNGNGVVPRSLYEQNRAQSFTYVDNTQNTGGQVAVDFTRYLDNGAEWSANAYYRSSRSRTFNGDGNEIEDFRFGVGPFEPDQAGIDAALGAGAYNQTCSAPLGDGQAIAPGGAVALQSEDCPAANNRGLLQQDLLGFGLQYSWAPINAHKISAGIQMEMGQSDFRRSYSLGVFNADRTVRELHRQIEQVNVEASNQHYGLYAQDLVQLSEKTTLLMAGRFNHAKVKTTDRLRDPLINQAGQASPGLNNDYSYSRFNPSLGLSHQIQPQTTVYASLGTSNRVPTPIELACSDPNFPCLLPNAMAADPYLKQVVTTTFETGLRGERKVGATHYDWAFNLFRADNKDDIIFVTDGAGSGGFFQNYGKTRRQGIELDLDVARGAWDFSASYQYLDATFQTPARLASEGNITATDAGGNPVVEGGFITVLPGNKIPGLSEHNVKLSLGFKPVEKTTLFVDMQAQSEQYARGNENNQHRAGELVVGGDTFSFTDSGMIPGFAVFNLGVNHTVSKGLTLLARVNNIFDRKYFNGGVLGGNVFDRNGQLVGEEDDITYETFLAPGTPRNVWVGMNWKF